MQEYSMTFDGIYDMYYTIHATIFKRNHNSIQAVDRLYITFLCFVRSCEFRPVAYNQEVQNANEQWTGISDASRPHRPPPPPPPSLPIQKVQATALAVLITL